MSREERYQNFVAAMKLLGVELPAEPLKGVNISIELDRKYWIQVDDPYREKGERRIFDLKEQHSEIATTAGLQSPTSLQ